MASEKPKRRTQAERSSETQERVIKASVELLRLKGYAGFRVADVTEMAGVSRGAQSHHFPTKVDLVLSAISRVFDEATEASQMRIAAVKPDDDVIETMIADASDFFLGENFSIGLDMLGAAGREPELRDAVQKIARSNRHLVEDMWIGLLLTRGLSREDAEDVLWLVFSSIRGLSVRLLWQFDYERFERVKRITYQAARDLFERKSRLSGEPDKPAKGGTRKSTSPQ